MLFPRFRRWAVGVYGKNDDAMDAKRESFLFSTNLLLLRLTGFWRRPDPRPKGRWAYVFGVLQRAFFSFNVGCNVIFVASKLVHTALDTDSIRSVTENLSDVLCIAFSLLQLLVLIHVEDRMVNLVQKIDSQFLHVLHTMGRGKEDLATQQKLGKRLSLQVFFAFLGTGFNFGLVVTTTGKKKQALPIPIWTPFPQDDPGILGILLIVEATGVVLTVGGAGALSALLINSFLAVLTQFRMVKEHFLAEAGSLPEGEWPAEKRRHIRDRLLVGVKLHQDVIKLSDELCDVLAPFLSVQLATIVFMICTACFQISMNPLDPANIRFIFVASNVAAQSFVLCWMGTRLNHEAMDVQLGLQSGNWYLQGREIGYIVKFALMRSQKGANVVVGSNIPVGLPLFLEILRSSYSLLAFLQKRARNESI